MWLFSFCLCTLALKASIFSSSFLRLFPWESFILDDASVKTLWCTINETAVISLSSLSSCCFIPPQLIHNDIWRGTAVVFFKIPSLESSTDYSYNSFNRHFVQPSNCLQQLFKISLCSYSFKFPVIFKYFHLNFFNNFGHFALKF